MFRVRPSPVRVRPWRLLAVATPGPGVAAVLARSLTYGLRGAPPFIGGFVMGDLMWFAAAALGLAALAQSAQTVFLVARYAVAGYLLYLAYRLWTAPAKPLEVSEDHSSQRPLRLFLGAYALAASRARQFFRKASSIRLLNRGAGTAMAGAAVLVATQ